MNMDGVKLETISQGTALACGLAGLAYSAVVAYGYEGRAACGEVGLGPRCPRALPWAME